MTTSLSTKYTETRDSISTRALRLCGAIGQGETPTTVQLTEAAQALNMVVKKFQADGMQLWKRTTSFFTPVASQSSYIMGVGTSFSQIPPLKVIQVWYRTTSTGSDTPLMLITKQEYDIYSNKATTGTPNLIFYDPPALVSTGGEMSGTWYVAPVPDATFAANCKIYFTGQMALYNMDASTDNFDFPSYYFNAITWNLAAELAYEYGMPFALCSMLDKRAMNEHLVAMSWDLEEGSLFIQPSRYER